MTTRTPGKWSSIVQAIAFIFLVPAVIICTLLRYLFAPLARAFSKPGATPSNQPPTFDVICLSHVPWNHIWQRNHHTMTRLAQSRQVLYLQLFGSSYLHCFARSLPESLDDLRARHERVHIRMPLLLPGESRSALIMKLNRWILMSHIRWQTARLHLRKPALWFYYPGAAYLLDVIKPSAVIYDIQDEYSAFSWAPPDIAAREQKVLDRADLIFAGTHALYEKKKAGFRGEAHFYPCAVEFEHFNKAAPEALRKSAGSTGRTGPTSPTGQAGQDLTVPGELAGLPHPRLIYIGLIDARIDHELLDQLAAAHREWSIVLVGPVDPNLTCFDELAQGRPNVHLAGKQDYARLPEFLAASDVFLMPWKVNDLTRHINPTKTLEYLAAGKPVVSIRLPDLDAFFRDYVALCDSSAEFITACERAMRGEEGDRVQRGLAFAKSCSWESATGEMIAHIERAIGFSKNREPASPSQSSEV